MWRNYLASALGNLSRNRFYAVINVTGLALGVSAALLIALFVRDETSYDRFFPGYRDAYLLTESKDMIDRRGGRRSPGRAGHARQHRSDADSGSQGFRPG